jgi:hypothetical protein
MIPRSIFGAQAGIVKWYRLYSDNRV